MSSFDSATTPHPSVKHWRHGQRTGVCVCACIPGKQLGALHQLASWAVQSTGLASKGDTKRPTKWATKTRPTLHVPEEQTGVSEGHMHSPLHVPPTSHSFCGTGLHGAMLVVPVEGQAVGCAVRKLPTIAAKHCNPSPTAACTTPRSVSHPGSIRTLHIPESQVKVPGVQ